MCLHKYVFLACHQPVGFSFLFIIIIMVSKIFPVVASDQFAEKKWSSNTLHLGPLPSIICKWQLLVSSTIVKYTQHDQEIYSKKDINLFTQSSVKSPDKFLYLSRLHA